MKMRLSPLPPDLTYKLATTAGCRLMLLDEDGPADGVGGAASPPSTRRFRIGQAASHASRACSDDIGICEGLAGVGPGQFSVAPRCSAT